jgi:hypothetical protein
VLGHLVYGLIDAFLSREWFQYGTILYEHVGEIVVYKDGIDHIYVHVQHLLHNFM